MCDKVRLSLLPLEFNELVSREVNKTKGKIIWHTSPGWVDLRYFQESFAVSPYHYRSMNYHDLSIGAMQLFFLPIYDPSS